MKFLFFGFIAFVVICMIISYLVGVPIQTPIGRVQRGRGWSPCGLKDIDPRDLPKYISGESNAPQYHTAELEKEKGYPSDFVDKE